MIKNILSLTKFQLSFTVSLSCLFGYILSTNKLDSGSIYPFLAVLFLALGVSALNQIQEYKFDSLMPRTQNRPLPSKSISYLQAVIISSTCILLSMLFIYLVLGLFGVVVFIAVIIIYNFLYTKAKRHTIYAGVYGAILGVIPPYVGWISTDEYELGIKFIALGLFYFIWQIPHFWLLNLKYYKEYEKAGFPTITTAFGEDSLIRITFIWLIFTLISGSFLIIVFKVESIFIIIPLTALTLYMLYTSFKLLKYKNFIYNFIHINVYMLLLMILLVINALFT
ncbi:MAG: UbiA family prenyltransferase [Arcobacter sp.]|nr:UbiA family prenyltransferase [Arcobacter sp.]